MGKLSISFAILTIILCAFLGSVAGSLLHRVFGLAFLDFSLTGEPLTVAKDFYIIKILEVTVTPGALIGVLLGGWLLYKKGKN
ncbi:MAG: hypothetical protein RH862_18690 [Leptospiraceae bacterium]|jgi:hypothetical protein